MSLGLIKHYASKAYVSAPRIRREVNGQIHAPASFPTVKPPPPPVSSIHWIDGWVCLKAYLGAAEKEKVFYICRESKPNFSVVKSVA
jgi:hypothetical protein